MITVSLSNPLHKALPSSVIKPAIESCRLYTGGGITNKPGARYTCLYPLCTGRFSPRVAFRYFISDSFSVTSLLLTWLFYIAFSLFHSSLSTPFAAKSGLTTPDTALPILRNTFLQYCCIISITTYSVSQAELHGTNREQWEQYAVNTSTILIKNCLFKYISNCK